MSYYKMYSMFIPNLQCLCNLMWRSSKNDLSEISHLADEKAYKVVTFQHNFKIVSSGWKKNQTSCLSICIGIATSKSFKVRSPAYRRSLLQDKKKTHFRPIFTIHLKYLLIRSRLLKFAQILPDKSFDWVTSKCLLWHKCWINCLINNLKNERAKNYYNIFTNS